MASNVTQWWRRGVALAYTLAGVVLPAAFWGLVPAMPAWAEVLAHYTFEEYRDNEDPVPVLTPTDGFKMDPAVTGTFPNGPFTPNPDQDFINNALSNSGRLFGFHPDTIGAFSSDVPYTTVPQINRANNFSWDISEDIPVVGAEQGVRDLYDVAQGGENLLRPGMSEAVNYTFEISFKQSIQRGFQALIGRDYVFLDTIGSNAAPVGSARRTSPLGAFWLGIAANDGPGGTNEARIHMYTFNLAGEIAITDPGQTGNTYFGIGPVIQPDVWYDLAVIGDGTNANFYLKSPSDSELQLVGTLPQNGLRKSNNSAGWTIGRGQFDATNDGVVNGTPSDGYRGWLDEVRISNSVIPFEALLANSPVMPLGGDYNDDGVVDAADYTVYRDNLGDTFALPNRDPLLSGPVASGDYDYWRANFGNMAPGLVGVGSAVPEPAGAVVMMALLGLALARRARSGKTG